MNPRKLSVSVPESVASFVESYKREHALKTKSEVVQRALTLVREQELERIYTETVGEISPSWEVTLPDGLTEEAW
jgi:Arc/MetJ-type ribon-helix-helix transcriptional regulator